MKKTILYVFGMMLISGGTFAQSKFRLGAAYILSASTIKPSGSNMSHMGSGPVNNPQMNQDLGWKLNSGAALRAEYAIQNRWGVYLQTGYQQRGGIYKEYMDDYKPRYSLSYWDINLGVQFKTKALMIGHQFLTNLGITRHSLLSASRVYDTGSDNITDEFNSGDIGIYLGMGGNIPIFKKDVFQVLMFGNYSLTQLYSGNFEMNGMMGKNLSFGVQLGYLIGKQVNKE